jgi:hypothetical protein
MTHRNAPNPACQSNLLVCGFRADRESSWCFFGSSMKPGTLGVKMGRTGEGLAGWLEVRRQGEQKDSHPAGLVDREVRRDDHLGQEARAQRVIERNPG